MTGRHVLEVKILVAGLFVATIGCAIAVPTFGQLGAAFATCAAVAVTNLARVWFVRRDLGTFPFGRDVFTVTAVGVLLAQCANLVVAPFSLPTAWDAAAGISCFVAAYGVAVWTWLLRETEKAGVRGAVAAATRVLFARPSHS
jgi:O-antigen/teichoic acid export membrane protein